MSALCTVAQLKVWGVLLYLTLTLLSFRLSQIHGRCVSLTHTRTTARRNAIFVFFSISFPISFEPWSRMKRRSVWSSEHVLVAWAESNFFFRFIQVNALLTGFSAPNQRSMWTKHCLCGVSCVKALPLQCNGPIYFNQIYWIHFCICMKCRLNEICFRLDDAISHSPRSQFFNWVSFFILREFELEVTRMAS